MIKKNASIIRIGQFMRHFESMMPHLLRADKGSVATTLEIVAARNSNGWTRNKDGTIRMGPSIPKDWYWSGMMDRVNPKAMDPIEKRDYYEAFSKVFPKLSHDTKKRGMTFLCKNSS